MRAFESCTLGVVVILSGLVATACGDSAAEGGDASPPGGSSGSGYVEPAKADVRVYSALQEQLPAQTSLDLVVHFGTTFTYATAKAESACNGGGSTSLTLDEDTVTFTIEANRYGYSGSPKPGITSTESSGWFSTSLLSAACNDLEVVAVGEQHQLVVNGTPAQIGSPPGAGGSSSSGGPTGGVQGSCTNDNACIEIVTGPLSAFQAQCEGEGDSTFSTGPCGGGGGPTCHDANLTAKGQPYVGNVYWSPSVCPNTDTYTTCVTDLGGDPEPEGNHCRH